MDKKETTRLLNNLIQYNRVDINNMKGTFPELGDAFMNVILAIDEEYGSGNIDRTLLRTPAQQPITTNDFEEFGKQFVGRFLYKEGGKEWYYFDSLISFDEKRKHYVYAIYTNNAFSKSNVAENITWTKENLEENFKSTGVQGWLPFNLKPGDKVAIPETYKGVKITATTAPVVIARAIKKNQDYLYIKDLYDIRNGQYYLVLTNDLNEVGGDFFIMQDVKPYKQSTQIPQSQYSFKEGDSFKYGNDEYKIEKIYEETNSNGIIKDVVDFTYGKAKNSIDANILEEKIKKGIYTLVPNNINKPNVSVNYITQWTPDWKARGLRPSPTRKASLEKVDALGLGNDGIIYKVEEDKKGVKKWKKTGYTKFNGNNRDDFSSKYDLELLYDQLVYENTQLDSTDIDYKENEKLISIIINKLK